MAGIHTVLYLQDFPTNFIQDLSLPPLALASLAYACLGADRSNVETKPWRQGFAEAVEDRLSFLPYGLGRISYFMV